MKHRLVLLSAVLLLALLCALRGTSEAARAPRAAVPLPPAPSLPLPLPGEPAAERFSYDFAIDQEILIEAWKAEGVEVPELRQGSKLTGRLLVRALPAGAVGLEAAEVEHEGADAIELMRGEVILKDGAVSFPDGMHARGRLAWRRLLLLWPGRLEAGTREEEDSTGVAVIECERVSGDVWLRRKVAYKTIRTSGPAFRGSVEVSGETRIEMDGLPLRVEGEESVALRPLEGPVMRSAARFHLVRTGSERFLGAPVEARAFEPLFVAPRELAPRMAPAVALERARVCVATLRGMDDRTTLEHNATMMDLVEALEASPEAVEEIMALLRAGAADDDRAQELVVALAAAGTDPAQKGLAEILGGDGHLGRLRETAIVAAVQVEEPQAGIEAALAALVAGSDDGYALCALAAVGDRVRGTQGRFRAIQRTVLGKLAAASDAEALCIALEAVGNLGPEDVPEAVKLAAKHADDDVRRAAARSLLRVREPQADRMLVALLGDASPRVRAAAIDTLVRRDREGLLTADPLPAPLPQLLAGIAENDEDQGVRDVARSLAAGF